MLICLQLQVTVTEADTDVQPEMEQISEEEAQMTWSDDA